MDIFCLTTLKATRWTVHYSILILEKVYTVVCAIGGKTTTSSGKPRTALQRRRAFRKAVEKCKDYHCYVKLCREWGVANPSSSSSSSSGGSR